MCYFILTWVFHGPIKKKKFKYPQHLVCCCDLYTTLTKKISPYIVLDLLFLYLYLDKILTNDIHIIRGIYFLIPNFKSRQTNSYFHNFILYKIRSWYVNKFINRAYYILNSNWRWVNKFEREDETHHRYWR